MWMCRYLFTALMCGCGDVSYICPTYNYIQLLTIKHPSYISSLLLILSQLNKGIRKPAHTISSIYLYTLCGCANLCKSVSVCMSMSMRVSMCVCRCIVCWNNIQLCAVVHICDIATCCRLHPDSVVAASLKLCLWKGLTGLSAQGRRG